VLTSLWGSSIISTSTNQTEKNDMTFDTTYLLAALLIVAVLMVVNEANNQSFIQS
jgi:hypothetical protein